MDIPLDRETPFYGRRFYKPHPLFPGKLAEVLEYGETEISGHPKSPVLLFREKRTVSTQTQYNRSTLDAVDALTESVTLPADFSVALMSGRPEMVKMIRRPNGLNAQETEQIAHAFGVMLQTNQALQDHVKTIAEQVKQLHGTLKGVMGKTDYLRDLANFREPLDTTSEY